MMSSSQSIPFFQQHQYKCQPPVEEDSPTIHKSKMLLLKELSHDNRLDDDASSNNNNNIPRIFLPSVSQPTKRKRDDIDEIAFSRRQDHGDDSSSSGSSDEEDDDGYILFPLHKRYASSSSAFNVSSYDFERREGPADSSSSTHAHDSSSFVDDTTSDTFVDDNESDDVLDEETAALVSNFRTSIFRQQTSTTMTAAVPVVQQPMPITPLSDTSFTCSLYADDDNDGVHYPDFPSIGRATTIDEDSSSRSSIFSNDPPDMMDNSSRPTSPSRYEEEEIMIEHHDEHCYEEEEEDESSSPSSWSSIEEKDADEEARERPHPTWLVSTDSSSRTRLEPSQPSPLWMPNRGY